MLLYIVLRLTAFIIRRLPQRWVYAVARWLGRLVYRVSPLAEAGRDNFYHVLGSGADPAQVSQLTCQAFQSRLLNYADLLRMPTIPLEELNRHVVFEGIEHLEQIVVENRGGVVVSGHIGPLEYMIQSVAALGYPLIGITEHLSPKRLHRYVMSLRTAHGLELISTRGSLLDIFRRLKRGQVLLSAGDRDSTDTGVVVDFFGEPAWVPDGYARVAVRANVPLIFGFCRRAENGTVVNKIFPPMHPDRSLSKEKAVMDLVRRTVRLLEEAIRTVPDEWHLSAPIWQLAHEKAGEGETA